MILSGLLLLLSATPAAATDDYIPAAWRDRAREELILQSSRANDLKEAWLDDGLAQLKLGPFETLDFIRSNHVDPREVAHVQRATFEVTRSGLCTGTIEVYETHAQFGDSLYLDATLLGVFDPKPRQYDAIAMARRMARSPHSICELVLPLELSIWRVILIDTGDQGTLVMEYPRAMPGEGVDSSLVKVQPIADWSAHAKTSLRAWLRLDQPLRPVSHEVPAAAMNVAEVWMNGDGRHSIAGEMAMRDMHGSPSLGDPTVEFFLTEFELALYAESNVADPTRFDLNPRYIVPIVVEGRELMYPTLMSTQDELGRHLPHTEDGFAIYGWRRTGMNGESDVRPAALLPYGHVAIIVTREMGLWYHVLGPEGARIASLSGPRAALPDLASLDAFAGWAKLQIRSDFHRQ